MHQEPRELSDMWTEQGDKLCPDPLARRRIWPFDKNVQRIQRMTVIDAEQRRVAHAVD